MLSKLYPVIIIFLLSVLPEIAQHLTLIIVTLIILLKERLRIWTYLKNISRKRFIFNLILTLLIYQFLNYLFAIFTKRSDLLTFPLFLISFWAPMSLVLLTNRENSLIVRGWLRGIIIFQLGVILFQTVMQGFYYPNDGARGLTISAHYMGFCLIWILFTYIFDEKYSLFNVVLIILSTFGLFLTDAKTPILLAIVMSSLLIIVLLFKRYPWVNFVKIVFYITILCLVLFLSLTIEKNFPNQPVKTSAVSGYSKRLKKIDLNVKGKILYDNYRPNKLIDIYVEGEMNHKYVFIERGFQYLFNNNLLLIGTSPGTLGSRASNLRAVDTLYKPEGRQIPFLSLYSSPATQEIYKGLYSEEYNKAAILYINTLALPFSSFFSFLFENGLIGLIILFLLIILIFKSLLQEKNTLALESIFQLLLILFWGLFDTIWERPFLMSLFYLIFATNLSIIKASKP